MDTFFYKPHAFCLRRCSTCGQGAGGPGRCVQESWEAAQFFTTRWTQRSSWSRHLVAGRPRNPPRCAAGWPRPVFQGGCLSQVTRLSGWPVEPAVSWLVGSTIEACHVQFRSTINIYIYNVLLCIEILLSLSNTLFLCIPTHFHCQFISQYHRPCSCALNSSRYLIVLSSSLEHFTALLLFAFFSKTLSVL